MKKIPSKPTPSPRPGKIGINQLSLCFLLNRGILRKIEIKANIKEQKAPLNGTEIVPYARYLVNTTEKIN
jgi:hypothetical protein